MTADLHGIAESLAGAKIDSVTPAKSGGNSQVFCIETAAGRFALKAYPDRTGDTRERAEVEWRTLQFLAARGVASVPRPLARDGSGRFLLMEWIEGASVAAHDAADLTQAADFIAAVFALSRDPGAGGFPPASQACLCAAEIVRQIDERLPLLTPQPALKRFLERDFAPLLSRRRAAIASDARASADLPAALRRLIPADFGFHNALRQADGSLRFVDFEYFGWDDPVKLTADFLLHPAMRLSAEDRRYFVRRMAVALAEDGGFLDRLRRLAPLFALRWMLILLNPFRSDRVTELPRAGHDRDALLQDRLAKALALAGWVEGNEPLLVATD